MWTDSTSVNILTFYFSRVHFNTVCLSMSKFANWCLIIRFSDFVCIFYPICAACFAHLILIDYPTNIWWTINILKLFIMQFSPSLCYFHPKFLLCTLLSHTASLCSSLDRWTKFQTRTNEHRWWWWWSFSLHLHYHIIQPQN